ncbi:MAG TPA: exodeoxyribonuclease III [Gammaproteobacteria bacterium]|nr:exodeoxyribonuclease III [Gammaproteobacteria bacterium]
MALRIITLNVNGIRSAARKGFFSWLEKQNADIVCLQEIRAHQEQLSDPIYFPKNYHCYYVDSHKKGYSGVALFTKHQPIARVEKLGYPLADDEARYIHVEFANLIVVSLYLPSGTSGDARQQLKYAFMDWYWEYLQAQITHKKPFIICGDWNIAHKKIDLKNWRSNQKRTGFLPEERAWLDKVFQEHYVDAFRVLNQDPDQYTWWSNFRNAWDNNVGWRIDYQVISPLLKDKLIAASIYKEERFSDHAPLIMDYAIELV